MNMVTLGKLERETNLRSVWKNEARDFTPWLEKEENIKLLSDAVGIDIIMEEKESAVGNFNVDLFAKEKDTGKKIIIENQLEQTNHDHLGKIITYASGKDAGIVIWVVSKARDEHRQAVEWLNQHTDENCAFFLLEIELWKVDGSNPAPKFNVVERPNDWAKVMRRDLTPNELLELEFWTEFKEYAEKNMVPASKFKLKRPRPQNWYNISIGYSAFYICLVASTRNSSINAGIYITEDEEIFKKFQDKEERLKRILGVDKLEREDKDSKAFRFMVVKDKINISERERWNEAHKWLYEQCLNLKKAVDEIMG